METGEPIPGVVSSEGLGSKEPSKTDVGNTASITAPTEVPPDIEQIKKKLIINPRESSKSSDVEGRREVAQKIFEARASERAKRDAIEELKRRIDEISSSRRTLSQQERNKKEELAERKESPLGRLLEKIPVIKDWRVAALEKEINMIREEILRLYDELVRTEGKLHRLEETPAQTPSWRQLLESYYVEIASKPPLSVEEKKELLKPEVLASLTTEEYIALWRRLNPYFLAHVTRQGFRDHYATFYHKAGLWEFHNGFLNVMQDDRLLRPPIAIIELKNRDEASVRQWLNDWVLQAEDEKQARKRLNNLLHFHLARAPKYPDKTAVHFSAQILADDYYGGEIDNEAFFIYPTDFIASQYVFAFNGRQKDFTRAQSETAWNDVFVWPENPGISIDAGIVFLPETTPVDPKTGSKYASEVKVIDGKEKRVMIEDTSLVGAFVEWGKKLNDESSELKKLVTEYKRRETPWEVCFRTFLRELEGLGFKPDASTAALASELIGKMYCNVTLNQELLEYIIRDVGAHWKRAENTIPAKEYWESFFSENPHLKPKHVWYYKGDPTSAVYKFLEEHKIGMADTSETDGPLLGFGDNHVSDMENDPRANSGYDDLVAKAYEIIEEHYRTQST